jgi:hypothetical protein
MQMGLACLETRLWLSHWLYGFVLWNRSQKPPGIFCVSCSHHRTVGHPVWFVHKPHIGIVVLDQTGFNSTTRFILEVTLNWRGCMLVSTYTSRLSFQWTTLGFPLTRVTVSPLFSLSALGLVSWGIWRLSCRTVPHEFILRWNKS